jgi:RNA polymerase sigma-70 factor, ECF subfamily
MNTDPSLSKTDEFNELIRCYGDLVYRMAFQLTSGDETEARDLVQDGFIKAWRYWVIQKPDNFKGWMYRLLHNLYMDVLRKRARQKTCSLDAPTPHETSWEQVLPDDSPEASARLETQDVQSDVQRALQKLDPEFRMPVMLCDMEGLSYEEIARIMSCPVGTVRSRIHRGRMQLRRLLSPSSKGATYEM